MPRVLIPHNLQTIKQNLYYQLFTIIQIKLFAPLTAPWSKSVINLLKIFLLVVVTKEN